MKNRLRLTLSVGQFQVLWGMEWALPRPTVYLKYSRQGSKEGRVALRYTVTFVLCWNGEAEAEQFAFYTLQIIKNKQTNNKRKNEVTK